MNVNKRKQQKIKLIFITNFVYIFGLFRPLTDNLVFLIVVIYQHLLTFTEFVCIFADRTNKRTKMSTSTKLTFQKVFQKMSLDEFQNMDQDTFIINIPEKEDFEIEEVEDFEEVEETYVLGDLTDEETGKKKDFYTMCSDYSKILVLNNITAQLENGFWRLEHLIRDTKRNETVKRAVGSLRKNYNLLYEEWTSDNNDIKDMTGKEYNKRVRRNKNKPDFSTSFKTQYNLYRKELIILRKIEKFIRDDEHVKEVVLDVVGDVLDDVKEEIEKNGKKHYQNDYYLIKDVVNCLGEDQTFLLMEGIANLEMIEERIRKCHENMGRIANEIFV